MKYCCDREAAAKQTVPPGSGQVAGECQEQGTLTCASRSGQSCRGAAAAQTVCVVARWEC